MSFLKVFYDEVSGESQLPSYIAVDDISIIMIVYRRYRLNGDTNSTEHFYRVEILTKSEIGTAFYINREFKTPEEAEVLARKLIDEIGGNGKWVIE